MSLVLKSRYHEVKWDPVGQSDFGFDAGQAEVSLRAIEAKADSQDIEKKVGWIDVCRKLTSWKNDPSLIDDGDSELPSMAVIDKAIAVAMTLYSRGCALPKFVIPIDGTIEFERRNGTLTENVIVHENATAEYIGLRDSAIFLRQPFRTR